MKALRAFVAKVHYLWRLRAEHTLLWRQASTIEGALLRPAPTELGAGHHALIRALRVSWIPVESGAPGLSPTFPFGWLQSTGRIGAKAIGSRDETLLARMLVEVGKAVPLLARGAATLAPGRYPVPDDMRTYFNVPESGVTAQGLFDFRNEHATLLRHCIWRMDLFAQPCWPLPNVDGKRPYGDCAYFEIDVASILGRPFDVDADGDLVIDDDVASSYTALHQQMLTALQVFLYHAALPQRLGQEVVSP